MPRSVFEGARVIDGTGADPAPADIAVEDGRIAAVGPGLDADGSVDCAGRSILPGLFDWHVTCVLVNSNSSTPPMGDLAARF